MKYLTFTIPCYNSEAYMERCIQSLLPGGNDVEIIIVNDGSSDGTRISQIIMKRNIRRLSVQFIKRMVDTDPVSMLGWNWQRDSILKWWIPTTGWQKMPIWNC